MKRRLLAAILSVALLSNSMPVYAAETGGEITAEKEEEALGKEASKTENAISESAVEKSAAEDLEDVIETPVSETIVPETSEEEDKVKTESAQDSESSTEEAKTESAQNPESNTEKEEAETESAQDSESSTKKEEAETESAQDSETPTEENTIDREEEFSTATDESDEYESEEESSSDEELGEGDETAQEDIVLALNTAAEVTIPAYYGSRWCSFIAPEAGYYQFKLNNPGKAIVYPELFDGKEGKKIRKYLDSPALFSDWVAAGATLYVKAVNYETYSEATVQITAAKIESHAAVQDNGSYIFDTSQYKLTVSPNMGCKTMSFDVKLDAKDGWPSSDANYDFAACYRQSGTRYYTSKSWDSGLSVGDGTRTDTMEYLLYGDENINPDTLYDTYFLLKDRSKGDILAVFNGGNSGENIGLKTVAWPQGSPKNDFAAVHSKTVTSSGVTFDIEFFEIVKKCRYAPKGNPEQEKQISFVDIFPGRHIYTFNNRNCTLESGETYLFRFGSEYSNSEEYEVEAALENVLSGLKTTCNAGYANDRDKANVTPTITVNVLGYTGNAKNANMKYSFTDELGKTHTYTTAYSSLPEAEPGAEKVIQFEVKINGRVDEGITADKYVSVLQKNKSYNATVQFTIGGADDEEKIIMPEQTIEFSTGTDDGIDAIGINMTEDRANGKVKFEIDDSTDKSKLTNLNAGIFYRQKGDREYASDNWSYYRSLPDPDNSSYNPQPDKAAHEIQIDKGVEYEFVIMAGGHRIEKSVILGEADLKLEKVTGTDAKNENKQFNIVRTFKVIDNAKTAPSSGTYSLHLSYWDESGYMLPGSVGTFNLENSYQACVNTADTGFVFEPDKDYTLKWELKDSGNNAKFTLYEKIRTSKAAVTLTSDFTSYKSIKLNVAIAAEELADFTATDKKVGFDIYIKKKDEAGYKYYNAFSTNRNPMIYLNAKTSNAGTGMKLESGESYDIALRMRYKFSYWFLDWYMDDFATSNSNIITTQVTMPEDTRTITKMPETNLTGDGVTLNVKFSGNELGERTAFYLYYRKKKTGEWITHNQSAAEKEKVVSFTFSRSSLLGKLIPNTAYEYAIGIYNNGSFKATESPDDIARADWKVSGEFTTPPDNRKITASAGSITGASAQLAYALSGNPNLSTIIYQYYREKGAAEWTSEYGESKNTTEPQIEYTLDLKNLKPGTEYEYAIVIDDYRYYDVPKPETVTKADWKATGTFTTLPDTRKVTASLDSVGETDVRVSYRMIDNPEIPTYIVLFYREKNSTRESWKYDYSKIDPVTAETAQGSLTNTDLRRNTEYEYAIVLCDDGRFVSDTPNKITNPHLKAVGTFSTADPVNLYVNVFPFYARTDIRVSASNINSSVFPNGVYAHVFYKEQDGSWIKARTIEKNNVSEFDENVDIYGLKQNTRYEWAVVLSGSAGITSPDGFSGNMKKTGSFTLQTLECTLDFEFDSITYNSAACTLKASGNFSNVDYLTVDLALNRGEEYKGIRLSRNRDGIFSAKKKLDGLSSSTEYAIAKAKVTAYEYNNDNPAAYKELLDINGAIFATKTLENPPTGIAISEKTLKLNSKYASKASASPNGYDSVKLSAAVTPGTAPADAFWTSSNESAAIVSQDGIVTAKGAGTATITVASKHAANVKDTCEVTVASYAAGYKAAGASMPVLSQTCTAIKGETLKEIALYDWSNPDSPAVIADYTAESENEKIAVFDKESKTIESKGAGETYITFEADGYKARLKVNVTPAAKGFGVASVSNSYYPAVKNADGSYILAYKPADSKDQSDGTYKVNLEIAPKGSGTVNEGDFTWTSDKTDVASVSGQGVITPLNPGDVTLTIKRKDESYENVNEAKVKLSIKAMPDMDGSKDTISVLTNPELDIKKLSDVKFPAGWEEGWQWKEPDAPLVTNGADTNASHKFEAFYADGGKYPMKAVLTVKIGKVTGVRIEADNRGNEAGLHNHVLKTEKDELALSVSAAAQGSVSASAYTTGIPDVDGLAITKNGNAYTIKADRPGSYTLTPSIYAAGTDKVLAKAAYKITAVSDKVAASVSLSTDTEGVSISSGMISLDDAAKTDFNLTAEALDQDRQPIDPYSFVWKTTDKSVAKITLPERGKSGRAKIEIKGSGHAVLTAVASDKRQASASIRLEVKDHAPRVDTGRANVNIAYDYSENDGRMLAAEAGGAVEIVPVYAGDIESVELREEGSETPSDRLEAQYNGGYSYIIQPTAAALAEGSADKLEKGTYKCRLLVTTRGSRMPYEYGLTVKVTDSKPKVTAKMGAAPNLFYTYTTGTISLSISGKERLNSTVRWTDSDAQNTGNGFAMGNISYDAKGKPYIRITQQPGLEVNAETGKTAPEAVAQGSLYIKLNAYREEYTFKDFQIKYSYKKPAMVTKNAQTAIVPAAGKRDSSFYVYNNTEKRYAYYMDRENYNEDYSYDIYSSVTADDKDVTLAPIDNSVLSCRYSYAGDEKSHDFTLTLDSPWWRESLTASHTAKAIDPAAYLDYSTVTLNTSLRSDAYNYVFLAGASRADMAGLFTKFDIEGADEKSKELLAKDYLVMTSSGNVIKAEQNRAEFMNAGGATIPAGTYRFEIKPYYYDNGSKKNVELNTLAFKVNVINSAVTAKVSPKGSLDLTYGMGSMPYDKKNVYVLAEPEFKNLSSGYGVKSCRLTGEYSEYFGLIRNRNSTIRYGGKWIYSDYIYVNAAGKLKAGQAYRLAIEYTLANAEGQEIKVTSNTFTIKPKQTLPKISVSGNNQTLYAGANLSRSCTLTVPAEYAIESASGSLDVNKDGAPDISATGRADGRYCYLTLSIADKDAVIASASGKSYSIPIVIKLRGRDGISKDAAVTVKVKVKR